MAKTFEEVRAAIEAGAADFNLKKDAEVAARAATAEAAQLVQSLKADLAAIHDDMAAFEQSADTLFTDIEAYL